MNTLAEVMLQNAVVAALLVVVVAGISRFCRRPAVIHFLWLLVLVKLLTPPLVRFPLDALYEKATDDRPIIGDATIADETVVADGTERFLMGSGHTHESFDPFSDLIGASSEPVYEIAASQVVDEAQTESLETPGASKDQWKRVLTGFLAVSLAGSLAWFVFLAIRVRRFVRLLRDARPAPATLNVRAETLSGVVGLRRVPRILLTPGHLPPAVWGWGASTRILIPETLYRQIDSHAQDALLVHELIHVRRGDHWNRLLELLATGLYWWNPLVWVARRELQEVEEQCCDQEVVTALPHATRAYAGLLIDTVDFLSGGKPVALPVTGAAGSVKSLHGRIEMVMRGAKISGWSWMSRLVVVLAALVVLPFGARLADSAAEAKDEVVAAEDDAASVAPPSTEETGRVLHFPKDRCLGLVMVRDATAEENPFLQNLYTPVWEPFRLAQGEVVLPPGKHVGLRVSKTAGDLSPLSKIGPNDLHWLMFDAAKRGDAGMPHVAHLTGLKELVLAFTDVTDRGMTHVRNLKSLERLTLSRNVTNRGLASLQDLTSLKGLCTNGDKIDGAGVRLIAQLRSLEEVTLVSDTMTDAELAPLSQLPSLRYVKLWGTRFGDASFAHLRRVRNLKMLDHHGTPITDAGLRHLAGHPTLESIELDGPLVTDRGWAHLKSLPSLKRLHLSMSGDQNRITEAGLAHLAEIDTLEYLKLPNKGVTEKGLAHLTRLKNLKYLYANGWTESPCSDAALRHLAKISSLEYLKIYGTNITDAGMDELAKLTGLKALYVRTRHVTNEGLSKLAALESLETLTFSSENVSVAGLSHLNSLTNLVGLEVQRLGQDNTGLDISGLTRLERLRISMRSQRVGTSTVYDGLRDEDLVCLSGLLNLEDVMLGTLRGSMIGDAGMAHLSSLTQLQRLQIHGPYLTDKSLERLSPLGRLNLLNVTGSFTDRGLQHLEKLPTLEMVHIASDRTLTPAAIERLERGVPYVNARGGRKFDRKTPTEIAKNPSKAEVPPLTNQDAPSFRVETLHGKEFRLADYRGKVVVLYFWATSCKPCLASLPKLEQYYVDMKETHGDRFEMIGLSMDDSEDRLRDCVSQHELSWPQARIGTLSAVSSDYRTQDRAPSAFLVGPDGKVLLTPESPKVNTKSFIKKLLAGAE